MKHIKCTPMLLLAAGLMLALPLQAEKKEKKKEKKGYSFTTVKSLPATPVKSQYRSVPAGALPLPPSSSPNSCAPARKSMIYLSSTLHALPMS